MDTGEDCFISDARLATDGFVYAVGNTSTQDEGEGQLQKWPQDGEMIWCKTLGGPGDDEGSNSIAELAGKLCVSGS